MRSLHEAYLAGERVFEEIEFNDFEYSHQLNAFSFKSAQFIRCWFHSFSFKNMDFESAVFEKCNLKCSRFINCNLDNTRWDDCAICNMEVSDSRFRDIAVNNSHAYGVVLETTDEFYRYVYQSELKKG